MTSPVEKILRPSRGCRMTANTRDPMAVFDDAGAAYRAALKTYGPKAKRRGYTVTVRPLARGTFGIFLVARSTH